MGFMGGPNFYPFADVAVLRSENTSDKKSIVHTSSLKEDFSGVYIGHKLNRKKERNKIDYECCADLPLSIFERLSVDRRSTPIIIIIVVAFVYTISSYSCRVFSVTLLSTQYSLSTFTRQLINPENSKSKLKRKT